MSAPTWVQSLDRVWRFSWSPDTIILMVQAQSTSQVRVVVSGGSLDAARTTVAVNTDMFGLAAVSIPNLPDAGASYVLEVQGLDPSAAWQSLTSTTASTARARGSAQRDIVVDVTCIAQDAAATIFEMVPAFLSSQGKTIDLWVNKGDFHYDNPATNDKDSRQPWQWIKAWIEQAELIPGMGAALATNFYTSPDDHDVGVLNAEFNVPNINYCFEALKRALPLPPAPLGMPSTGTFYMSQQRGEVLHVFPQFTSNYRSDPAAPDTGVNAPGWLPGDPRPTKTPFGTAQDNWLEGLLTSSGPGGYEGENGYVAYALWLNKGWDVTAGTLGGKTDHHHLYPAHRAWLANLMTPRRGIMITGDNHFVGASQTETRTGWLHLHNAGGMRNSGNTTWNPGMSVFYPTVPAVPGGVGDGVPLQCAGVVETSRDGATFTIRAAIYDALIDAERFVIERSWSSVPYVGEHGWFISDMSLEQQGIIVTSDSETLRVPAKRGANAVLAGYNGARYRADKRYEEGSLTHTYGLVDNASFTATREALAVLARRLDSGGLVELRHVDERGDRRALAEVVTSWSPSIFGSDHAFAAVTYTIPSSWFEDTLVTVQTLPFVPDADGKQTLWFTATAGSSAVSQNSIVRLNGSFPTPLVSDPPNGSDDARASGRYLGTVNPGNVFEINSEAMTVTENGIDKLTLWEQRGVGPFLSLTPRDSDGSYGVRVNVSAPPSGNPSVTLITRRFHKGV